MPTEGGAKPRWITLALAAAAAALACGEPGPAEKPVVRLGYFPNVTHAPAIVGLEKRYFADALGSAVKLEPRTFNAGPEAVEALFSDALDVTYIGPNPAINAFAQSRGEAVRIVAGATSGGAALVVAPSISKPADLKGKKLATPQLGNTQDVALRAWLKHQGLSANLEGGGDVSIAPQPNAQTLETFRSGVVQGAWLPEPWVSRLVLEGGGAVLVDERSLWPNGQFVTTHLVVRRQFLDEHPDLVKKVVEAHVKAVDDANADPAGARALVNRALERVTGKALPEQVIERAWQSLGFTVDPLEASLRRSAKDAEEVGLLEPVDLDGIYDLGALNEILRAGGRPEIALQGEGGS
jgi:NitT/TauT family transport system substrate-binding protein